MDEDVTLQALLVFGGSLLVGPAVGGLVGWLRSNFHWGAGTGALLIGLAGLYAASSIAWHRYQSLAGTERVEGRLVAFTEEQSRDGNGRTTVSRVPIVEYVAPDGRTRSVKGLGGGLSDKSSGDPVEVRYSPADPSRALVADFQNMWGAVWGLGMFGLFPTMFGVFFIGSAITEARRGGRPASPAAPTPAQRRRRRRGTMAANLVFVAGFAVVFLYPGDHFGRAIGAGFVTIGAGIALHFVVQSTPPAMDFQSRMILLIVAIGFLAFGSGAWLLG